MLHRCVEFVSCVSILFVTVTAFAEAPRQWSDSTGAFTVDATLVESSDGNVTLKKADGSTVTVPINRLSVIDQNYLSKLAKQPARPVEVLTDLSCDDRAELAVGNPVLIEPVELLPVLEPDGADDYLAYKRFQVLAGQTDAYDKISRPIVIDRRAGVFALSIGRHKAGEPDSQRGRIGRAAYGSSTVELLVDAKETVDLLDHHVPSGRTLAVCGKGELYRGGEIVLLRDLAETPQVVLRRTLPGIDKPGFKPEVRWGAMLDVNTAVLLIDDTISVVDLVRNECLFSIEKIRAGAIPAVSPGGRYLAVPTGGKVDVINTRTGETLGSVSVDTLLTVTPLFDPSGSKLLLGYGNQVSVWSLAEAKMLTTLTTPNPLGETLGWVRRGLILTKLAGLIDTELGMSVWRYNLPPRTTTVPVVDGILMADASGSGLVLRTMPIPHSTFAKMRLALAKPSNMLVRPGTAVTVKVNVIPGVDPEEVREAVIKAAEKVGWRIDGQSKIELVATIGRGEKQELQYRFGYGNDAKVSTAELTPFTANFEIRSKGQRLWSRKTRNFVPPSVFLTGGKTLQEAISEYEKPDASFFEKLTLPPRIVRPDAIRGGGNSRIDSGRWIDY